MPDKYDFDLVCIGSGPSGQRAAVQAAKLGKHVAVVEKQRDVGGLCLRAGTIPSKTFRQAVLSYVEHNHGAGRSPAQHLSARASVDQLLSRVEQVVQHEVEVVTHQLRRNDIELVQGEASFADPHTLVVASEAGVRRLTAAAILIAVGTLPAPPPGVAMDGEVVWSSDDLLQLKRLPRTMVVVGAGVIGIEYASMFAALGVEVTLIDKRTRLLDFLDEEIVAELMHQMRASQVTFRLGEAVERIDLIEGLPKKAVLLLESGKRIVSDLVLFSAGRAGATGQLNLPSAGLTADERGRLKVNGQFQTIVPHIFAAGDVIGYPSLAATSAEQGRLAACHMFNVQAEPMADHFPIGIYAIPEISMVGAPEHVLTEQKIPYETGVARYREIARGQILGDESGLVKLLFHREDRRVLGVHAIGTGAAELIHIGQAVLALKGGLDYFLHTVFNYPTLAECYKVAALNALNKLKCQP
ncbi:MAG: Si-specific NAD(P)(+) transhydrogenase [Nitrospiraceae bacterium]